MIFLPEANKLLTNFPTMHLCVHQVYLSYPWANAQHREQSESVTERNAQSFRYIQENWRRAPTDLGKKEQPYTILEELFEDRSQALYKLKWDKNQKF